MTEYDPMYLGLSFPAIPNLATPLVGNSDKYLISYMELKGPMPPVGIALLAALGNSHSLSNHPYFIRGGLD